jgi:hypothetical protein
VSVTDPAADPVQPEDSGQGGEGAQDAPYAEYLSRIPEDVRGDVEPVFKEWDASVTKRFQDAAEYRKSWEPYQQAGLNQYEPEYLAQAAQFAQVAQENPQAIQQWFQAYAQEHGLQAAQDAAEQMSEFDGYQDPQQQLEKLLEDKLGPLSQGLEEISQWRAQQEQAAQAAAYEQVLDGQLAELKSKHEETFKNFPGVEDMIQTYAAAHVNSNPGDWENAIPQAWQKAEGLINQVSKGTLQSKVDAPAPAEGGGVADMNREQPKSMQDANAEAKRLLQQWNRQ